MCPVLLRLVMRPLRFRMRNEFATPAEKESNESDTSLANLSFKDEERRMSPIAGTVPVQVKSDRQYP